MNYYLCIYIYTYIYIYLHIYNIYLYSLAARCKTPHLQMGVHFTKGVPFVIGGQGHAFVPPSKLVLLCNVWHVIVNSTSI